MCVNEFQVTKYLKKRCVLVVMNMETEWTIEPWHIRSSFRKSGIHIHSDSQIKLPPQPIKGPNMDLQDKDFYVTITVSIKMLLVRVVFFNTFSYLTRHISLRHISIIRIDWT